MGDLEDQVRRLAERRFDRTEPVAMSEAVDLVPSTVRHRRGRVLAAAAAIVTVIGAAILVQTNQPEDVTVGPGPDDSSDELPSPSTTLDEGFTCGDPLGCVSYPASAPVRLATALDTSGSTAALGVDSLRGVELALDRYGPVLGHRIELRNEDSMCSPAGGEATAQAIVGDPTVVAVIGTTCSTAALEAAPIISGAGYSMVSASATTPGLTAPDTRREGFFRVAPNDEEQAVAMAEFVRGQGADTSAVVVDGGPWFTSLGEVFVASFEGLGGTNLTLETAAEDGSDAASVIAAVVTAGVPDVLYLPVFDPLGSALVAEARRTPALDETLLAATDALGEQGFLDGTGADAEDMLVTAMNQGFTATAEYETFASAYFDAYGQDPSHFSPFAFDAATIVVRAVEAVAVVDGAGTLHIGRQSLREALTTTADYAGLTGAITCAPVGDCASTGYEILEVSDGRLVRAP